MSSLDSALIKKALGKGIVRRVFNDNSVGLRLRYVGTGTVTTVDATAATHIQLTTSDGGIDTYLFSAYATIGKLANAINKDGIFECMVVDCLRSENPDDMFIENTDTDAGTDDNGVVCYDVLIDDSGAATFSCMLAPGGPNFDKPDGHRVHLRGINYFIDNTAAIDGLTIWERDPRDGSENELTTLLNVDVSDTAVTFASGEGTISSNWDHELIVQIDGTVVDHASNYIQLTGESE